MADTRTEHLNLIKQDPEAVPDYLDDHSNLEILDEEVWKRGKAFNGQPVGEDGGFHIRNVPYAENLETSASQSSDESYIIRTSGGEASINDGDAWLTLLKGDRTHTGYVAQDIQMTVIPMARTPDPDITATLDEATFEAYVGQAGTYTVSYDGTEWDTSPTLYGLTVSNTPIEGDSITMVWDGEEDATVTVNAATRPTPESISATIDEDTFVAYVSQSGTTTLTYSTGWSADPALYGITVTGTPIAGDVIAVVYVKEVRGTITQSTPETFVSTGWNLYNHALGYARLIKYHEEYGFKVSGTYTALEFSTSITGTRTTVTPVSGYFTIPSDGYLFVTGGNNTNTQVWMTWSDWGTSANGGTFAAYTQSVIDISSFMSENFPYGLLQVGSIRDEINLNIGIATSNVVRQAYNATNLANAKASGRQYEYDEDYIYLERETPVTYSISVDGDYTASDHGMEYFTGTDQAVYAETIYGANLKNKLERDVLTISQQTLTSGEKTQVRTNIGAASAEDLGSKSSASGVTGNDAFSKIATLNSKLSYVNTFTHLGYPATKAALETLLNSQLSDMSANEIRLFRITPSGNFNMFVSDATYQIELKKGATSSYADCMIQPLGGIAVITGQYISGEWTFEEFVQKGWINTSSEVVKYNSQEMIQVKKSYNTVWVYMLNGNYDAATGGNLKYNGSNTEVVLPSGYRPSFNFRLNDDLSGTRLSINTDGKIVNQSGSAFTNKALRFATCFVK